MQKNKKIIIYLTGALFLIIGFIVLLDIPFYVKSEDYKCTGIISNSEVISESYESDVFIRITKFGNFITKSRGNLHLEIPNTWNIYYSEIKNIGYNLNIYRAKNELSGRFSYLSKSLFINMDGFGIFQGFCNEY